MATTDLTVDSFEPTVRENGIVLIDFWASWCGPCRQFAPIYEAASAEHPDIVFGKVDTEAERELAAGFEITSIPTLLAFRDQILVFAQPGALPAAALAQVIDAVKALDMDDVRRQLAAAQQAESSAAAAAEDLDDFAAAHAGGAYVLDVRTPDEYAAGHVPGAVNIPLSILPTRLGDLPSEGTVHVICAVGSRSAQAVGVLGAEGIGAVNVLGGTKAWAERGWPLER